MTANAPVTPTHPALADARPLSNRQGNGWIRVLWTTGAVLLVAMVFHLVAMVVRGDPVGGPTSLRKPADFAESTGLLCWSIALILPIVRTGRWARAIIAGSTLLFAVGETTVMAIQAWRRVPSHYNFSTPFNALLVRIGGAGLAAVFVIGVVTLIGCVVRAPNLSAGVRLGVLAGAAVLLVGCVDGLIMISNNSGVFTGSFGSGFRDRTTAYLGPGPATIGPEYLLIRPATAGGDLVLPHAIGIHGLLLLAVPAVLLGRTRLEPERQLRIVGVLAAGYLTGLGVLLVHAFRQRPLDALGPVPIAVLAAAGLAIAVGYAATARAVMTSRLRPGG
jgi:hypothetical protein